MIIVGCDYHPGFQQIAFVDTDTGELQERRLQHREEAEKFYRDLAAQGIQVRVGMEASGHGRWFERLLAELNFELWIGVPYRPTNLMLITSVSSISINPATILSAIFTLLNGFGLLDPDQRTLGLACSLQPQNG